MPAKTTAKPSAAAIKALRMATAMTALASDLPKPPKQPPREQQIINRIRVLNDVTLTPGRKLLKAALKAQRLSIHIGFAPNYLHSGEGSPTEGESDKHPSSPLYYYYGRDITKIEPRLVSDHIMLTCTATLSYGDGGFDVSTDEDAHHALSIIEDGYRDPELILYF